MQIKRIAALCLVLALVISGLSGCATGPKKYSDEFFDTFDTIITVTAYCESREEFEELFNQAKERFHELHQIFDPYHYYEGVTNLKTVNDRAFERPVPVPAELAELLTLSQQWYDKSDGKLNVAMGGVIELWRTAREEEKLPDEEALRAAGEHGSMADVLVDALNHTVSLGDPDLTLNLGAAAKGYAVEKVYEELLAAGYDNFLLNAGGNIKTAGAPPGRSDWSIGVQNPDLESDGLLQIATVGGGVSLVTSGTYQRYFTVDGIRYHHIIDPDTLYPGQNFSQVTVITPDSAVADFLSTTLFLLDLERGKRLVSSLPDTYALYVLPDGSLEMTEGMEQFLRDPA